MLKFFIFIIILNSMNLNVYADSVNVTADSAILIEAKTGNILYEKNISKKQYPASITKIMTALLALENNDLSETLTFSQDAIYGIEPGSSHIARKVGEQLTLEQALNALLLESANEVANGIAEHVDTSIEEFAKHMTNRAKELGAKNTNFVNPHGLNDKNHYTTAYDMSLIAREAIKYEDFRKIISTIQYTIPPTNKNSSEYILTNQHRMLKNKKYSSKYFYDGCEGGKSGYTDVARHTLVTYAKRDNMELISVVLKSDKPALYSDTVKLLDYGFNNFQLVELAKEESVFSTVNVFTRGISASENADVKIGSLQLINTADLSCVIDKSIPIAEIDQELIVPTIYTPVFKNDIVGELKYTYNGKLIGSIPLKASKSYQKVNSSVNESFNVITKNKLNNNIKDSNFLLHGLIIIIIISIVFILKKLKRKIR